VQVSASAATTDGVYIPGTTYSIRESDNDENNVVRAAPWQLACAAAWVPAVRSVWLSATPAGAW
jgi:hypothetical protein